MKKVANVFLAAALVIIVTSWSVCFEQAAYAEPGWRGSRGGRTGFGPGYVRHGGHSGIWFGPGWGLWEPFLYSGYPYPYYVQTPVVVSPQDEEYLPTEPPQKEATYWYYCRNPKGYYPYVKRCPDGWMKVVPETAPRDEEE